MDENTSAQNTSMQDYYNLIKAEHEANNVWSAEQAQKAMDYQTQMSNTAHQREVADLKAAGLNPVLSAGGSGATTGSGITAQRSDSNVEALYGLAKQAIDAQMTQAMAMQNTAKYVSGAAGYSDASGSSWYELGRDAAADFLKRKFGINTDTSKEIIDKAWNWLKDLDIETGLNMIADAYSNSDLGQWLGTSRRPSSPNVSGSIYSSLNKAKGISPTADTIYKLKNSHKKTAQAIYLMNNASSAKEALNKIKASAYSASRKRR